MKICRIYTDNRKYGPGIQIYCLYDSNSLRGTADCLMIDWSVPMRISEWFGTGTVIVDSESFFCMM